MNLAEAGAREVVERFAEALDRQWDAADERSWPHAPKHIREAHGDPSLPEPPSREAFDAWTAWLELRMNSLRRCRENLEKGRDALREEPARAEVYWKRAISTAERALAELDDGPDALKPVLGGATGSRTARMASAGQTSYNASLAWAVVAYGVTGLGTLIVLGVVAFMLGESVSGLVVVQSILLVIGFLPALAVMHEVLGMLACQGAPPDQAPRSTDSAAVVLPFVPPIVIAVVSWLLVTTY